MKELLLLALVTFAISDLSMLRQLNDEISEVLKSYNLETKIEFTDCGGSMGPVLSIDSDPYPPKTGQDLTLTYQGSSKQAFDITKVTVTGYVAGIPLITETREVDFSCPKGICTISYSHYVPKIVPAGEYEVLGKAQNDNDDNLVCARAKISVQSKVEDNVPVKDCNGSSATITSVDVQPYPPKIGGKITVSLESSVSKAYTFNKLHATVYISGIPIASQAIAAEGTCEVGSCSLSQEFDVPNIIPAGTYDVEVKAQNENDDNLACGKTTVTLVNEVGKSVDFDDCGGNKGTATNIDVSPYPPQIGKDITIDVTGENKEAFEITKLKATAYVSGIPISSVTQRISASCPKGTCHIKQTQNVPSIIPAGKYTLEVIAQNDDESNLVCARANIQLQ